MFSFDIEATDPRSAARGGRVVTPHGVFDTPAFMPVGTAGSVKGVTPEQLRATGTQIMLANTYHLQLRPTAEVVQRLGGLHRFSGWTGPMLSDSGGYQVFSLADIRRIDDDGVDFRSHVDGAPLRLDPRRAIDIQHRLGADICMAFDQCPPIPAPRGEVETAVERTVRWARQCREHHTGADQWLFGIVQGGLHEDLRRACAERLMEIGFDGYAIGGLSVGEGHEEMIAMLGATVPHLPGGRPRYLMGVGSPRDIYESVRCGVDMFDCVLPTRNGRNAYTFTGRGPLRLRNECHRTDQRPLERDCGCYACRHFSRGYLRHLFLAGEMLGPTLTSIHNLWFFQRFMRRIRELIREGKLERIRHEFPVVEMERDERLPPFPGTGRQPSKEMT